MGRSDSNFRMAWASIKATKWRSILTTLGVIIGVLSVVTIVSLGEGVKHQLSDQIKHGGKDLITVRGGQVAERDASGNIARVNLLQLFAGTNMNDSDYKALQTIAGVKVVAPFATVAATPHQGSVVGSDISIVATNQDGAQALNQDLHYGAFFDKNEDDKPVAVIGRRVAENLFKETVPIGKSFDLRGHQVVVRGIFDQFAPNPLNPGFDYNNVIFIPYGFAKQLNGNNPLQPYQILVRAPSEKSVDAVSGEITKTLKNAHGGQTDFTVLKANDNIAVAGNVLNMLTTLVSTVAAISLIVGGIGIMNIMLVSVSERTYEIGIRKAIGATNRQILNQFLAEAMVLSISGGILGVLAALLVNYLLRVFTSLQPVITFPIMAVAVLVALIVGVFFGITPALKAARKDPIQALRRV